MRVHKNTPYQNKQVENRIQLVTYFPYKVEMNPVILKKNSTIWIIGMNNETVSVYMTPFFEFTFFKGDSFPNKMRISTIEIIMQTEDRVK